MPAQMKPGPKPRPAHAKRSASLHLRVNPIWLRQAATLANLQGVSIADFIRSLVTDEINRNQKALTDVSPDSLQR